MGFPSWGVVGLQCPLITYQKGNAVPHETSGALHACVFKKLSLTNLLALVWTVRSCLSIDRVNYLHHHTLPIPRWWCV